jgi:hypothetical protein
MLAFRMVSSEKFKHVFSFNIASRDEDEIKKIL